MTASSYVYLIAFGGNSGDRVQNARGSLSCLQSHGRLGRQSRWELTQPLQSESYNTQGQSEYLNFVFEFETSLHPLNLYECIRSIEDTFGHNRDERWQSRAVDLDLLFYCEKKHPDGFFTVEDSLCFRSLDGTLMIPHVEFWNRDFLIRMVERDLQIPVQVLKPDSR